MFTSISDILLVNMNCMKFPIEQNNNYDPQLYMDSRKSIKSGYKNSDELHT